MKAIFFLIFFISLAHADKIETTLSKVVLVEDGDTVIAISNGQLLRLQLKDIDAPEYKNNPKFKYDLERTGLDFNQLKNIGRLAKQYLNRKIKRKTVMVKFHNDHYGRHVAELFLDGQSINRAMVSEGYARPLNKAWQSDYEQAKSAKLGLWRDEFRAVTEQWAEKN